MKISCMPCWYNHLYARPMSHFFYSPIPYGFHCSFFFLSTTGTLLPQDVCNCDLLFLESLCFRHLHRSWFYFLQVCVQKSLYECGLYWPPSSKYFYSRIFYLPVLHFIFMVLISQHCLFKIHVLPHNY